MHFMQLESSVCPARCNALFALVCVAACAPACAPDWLDPTISVEGVTLGEVSLSGTTAEVSLSVYNPNTEPLPFEHVEYEVRVGDSAPISGTAVFDEPLPALQSVTIPSTIRVPTRSALSIGGELAQGRTNYRLTGIMTLQYRGRRRVAFEREGDVMSDAPPR